MFSICRLLSIVVLCAGPSQRIEQGLQSVRVQKQSIFKRLKTQLRLKEGFPCERRPGKR